MISYIKFFLFLISVFAFQVSAMQDLPGPLPDLRDQPRLILAAAYRNLCRVSNNPNASSMANFSNALDQFENAINFPVQTQINANQVVVPYNQANFLTRANTTYQYITNIQDDFLAKNTQPYGARLKLRVDLARIDENVRLGHGVRSHLNHPNLSQNAQNTLAILSGRIFQVMVGANPRVVSASSGTLAQFNNGGIGMQNQLPPLVPGNNQILNSVMTCAHALESRGGRIISYFVPSNQIDLQSGLPNGLNLANNDDADLVAYLVNDLSSFRIISFRAQDKSDPLNPFFDDGLTMSHPQYLENEDCLIASIIPNQGGGLLQYAGNSTVNFFPHQPIQQNTRCFSMGYPGCFHYNLNAFNAHPYAPLINNLARIDPLFITSNPLNNVADIPQFNNGVVSCHIPTAKGMSGGAMFYEVINQLNNQSTIDIFGCVTGGDADDEGGYFL